MPEESSPDSKDATVSSPCLRIFLSVDLVGSTSIKEQKNHSKLLELFREREKALNSAFNKGLIKDKLDFNSPHTIEKIFSDHSKGDTDWAIIFEEFFHEFHSKYLVNITGEVEVTAENQEVEINRGPKIWKALGDELIYESILSSKIEAHIYTSAFIKTIRYFDEQGRKHSAHSSKNFRVKGTVWLAGFPIRNRELTLPGVQNDFLGPDIDIGFRIGKHSHSGFVCASHDLAYFLGTLQYTSQIKGKIVGWEDLKGVWGNIPYPIIWLVPNDYNKDHYEEFRPWSSFENKHAEKWKENGEPAELKDIKILGALYDNLPSNLGACKPYIASDKANRIPEEHEQIHKILKALNLGAAGKITEGDEPEKALSDDEVSELANEWEKKLDDMEEKKESSENPE